MKRYIGVIVVLAGLAAAFALTWTKFDQRADEADRDLDASRIQRDYLERVGWIRSNPDEKAYRDEVSSFFRWYFKQVDDHLAHFGGNKDFDDYLNVPEGAEKSEKGAKEAQLRKGRFQFVKGIFDRMRGGKYAPVWSGTDKGMRLDVLSADVKMSDGHPVIRLELVLWGAQREAQDDGRVKRMVTSASYEVGWKLTDAQGKLLGKMSGGDPSMKIDYPERVISFFPPQMVLGYYDLDPMPANVAQVETTFTISSRSPTGGEAKANFVWKLEPPAEWKLRPGEAWSGAQETTLSEEEIDPAAAAAKAKGGRK